jgi:hypothetical protein
LANVSCDRKVIIAGFRERQPYNPAVKANNICLCKAILASPGQRATGTGYQVIWYKPPG